MDKQNKELDSADLLSKLISHAKTIDKNQTSKLRSIASRILKNSAKREIDSKQLKPISDLVSLGIVSAIKKIKGTYLQGEFVNSLNNRLISHNNHTELFESRLYSAMNQIQKEDAKRLNRTLEINMNQSPTKSINFLIYSRILLVQAAIVEYKE